MSRRRLLMLGASPRAASLDLNFLRGALDPRISFSRASAACYYDATGTLQSAATNAPRFDYGPTPGGMTNWLLHSSTIGATGWSWSNVTATTGQTGPTGLADAVLVTSPSAGSYNRLTGYTINAPVPSGAGPITTSWYLKYTNNPWVMITTEGSFNGSVTGARVWANLQTGALGVVFGPYGPSTNASGAITPAANGWYRLSLTFTLPPEMETGLSAYVTPVDGNNSANNIAGASVLAAETQLEIGTTASQYVPTGASPANIGAIPLGLLIEESRTNSIRNNTMQGVVVSGTMAAPAAPTLGSTAGGTLAATTYYVTTTYVDGAGGETVASAESSLAVAASNLLTVTSPAQPGNAVSWRVYVSTATGTETLQATTAIGTNWTEPTTGLVAGASQPTTGTAKTSGTLPTNWNQDQNTNVSWMIVGTGAESGINYFDIRLVGTVSGGNNFNIRYDTGTSPAGNSQSWTLSHFLRIVVGTFNNVQTLSTLVADNTQDLQTSCPFPSSAGLGSQRIVETVTTASTGVTYVNSPGLQIVPVVGAYIDFTLRIGLPQLELGSFATSPILTSGSAVTRAADLASMSTSLWINSTAGSVEAEFILGNAPANARNSSIVCLDDGTANNNNVISLYAGSSIVPVASIRSSGVGTTINMETQGFAIYAVGGGPYKLAIAYNQTSAVVMSDGTGPGVATLSARLPTVSRLLIGSETYAGITPLNGYLRRIRYWPRTLSNSELQGVTR